MPHRCSALTIGVVCAVLAITTQPAPAQTAADCEKALSSSLATCFNTFSRTVRKCYLDTGQACPATAFDQPAAKLAQKISSECTDTVVQQLGFGPTMTVTGMVARMQEACRGEVAALTARTFGGPHAAVLATAVDPARACLEEAAESGAKLIKKAFKQQSNCVRRSHLGKTCVPADVDERVSRHEVKALDDISAACTSLQTLIALDPNRYVERALAQTRCMVAAAHADVAPLDLDCGPRTAVPVPARGQWVQVVLDGNVWGTRCGNGSPYAFWLRLAPNGEPAENVLIDLQGGGVCLVEADCAGVPAGLMEALNDYQPSGPSSGYFSTNAANNPFANWTMMALPYCTQDVHIGGGMTSAFPTLTVERFGAVNVRTALRYLRDVLWAELDATTADGFRPDRLRVLFAGVSAGGFGVEYNYHYVLDDLRWAHTTAAPDSALGLDNGQVFGIATLGLLATTWGSPPFEPPYCFANNCLVVPLLQARTAPRLKAVPEQQILNISNQVDNTQRSTTQFATSAAWTNAARQAYCTNQGLTGIRYWLPANPTSIHGYVTNTTRYTTHTSDSVILRDWLGAAMSDPDGVADRVEEGTLTTDPNILPFACTVD